MKKEIPATKKECAEKIIHCEDEPIVEVAPGMKYHIISSERMTVGLIDAAPNSIGPSHKHEAEQILLVLDGACEEAVEGKLYPLKKGDALVIPSNVEHGTYMSDKGCLILDIYSPPRKDYLVKLAEVKRKIKNKKKH